jgi:hypothetical protein
MVGGIRVIHHPQSTGRANSAKMREAPSKPEMQQSRTARRAAVEWRIQNFALRLAFPPPRGGGARFALSVLRL